ncbi:hypothetical protein MMC22_007519 [Lobaria immixta]|nr:hypothetical protein [Lobaria immixta]
MATLDPETQAHAAAGPSLLGLPPEVSNPRENFPFLNGENTFGIHVHGFDALHRPEVRRLLKSFRFDDILGSFRRCHASIDKCTRLEIAIQHPFIPAVRLRVRSLCYSVLRKLPALQHVRLHLLSETSHIDETVLGPFGVLRNLHSVAIHGVPLPYAKRLEGLMLGNTPQPDVEGMYRSLERFVRDLNGDQSDLEEAMEALQEWDIQKFKEIRSKILLDCQRRMDHALLHVFAFDAISTEDRQSTTA